MARVRVHLVVRLAVEGRRRAKQYVHDHADRPHVTRLAVAGGAACEDFGRDVSRRAAPRGHRGVGGERDDLGQAEVGDLELGVRRLGGEQDALGLRAG